MQSLKSAASRKTTISPKAPRILIRTFPPNSNPNYGGILQAWALHQAIDNLGGVSFVDSTRANRPSSWRNRIMDRTKAQVALRAPARLLTPRVWARLGHAFLDRKVLSFAKHEIRQAAIHGRGGGARTRIVRNMDAFVVGSDQVWRPAYMDVASNLFDFVPPDISGPRISYAASFGTGTPEFTDQLIELTAPLARRLNAVSVREDSGVEICRRLWGVHAVQVPDPTFLVTREDYLRLSGISGQVEVNDAVATYLLDATPRTAAVISSVQAELGTNEVIHAHRSLPASALEYRRDPARFDRLSVPEWLSMIMRSRCLITDSFHGCVFAVIFERPFLVIPNVGRGSARFESLLRLLGLEDRLVGADDDLSERMSRPIDWGRVRRTVHAERQRGLDFLSFSLGLAK